MKRNRLWKNVVTGETIFHPDKPGKNWTEIPIDIYVQIYNLPKKKVKK